MLATKRNRKLEVSVKILLALSFVSFSACTINEPKVVGATSGGGGSGGGGGGGGSGYSYSPAVDAIVNNVCVACHDATGQGNLNSNTFANIASLTTTSASFGGKFVIPGNAAGSVLYQKVLGTAASGARMPYGGPYLNPTQVAAIASWINGGCVSTAFQPAGEEVVPEDIEN